MTQLGKLGLELIEIIEELIANGPSENGDKEKVAELRFERFIGELDYIYCQRLSNNEQDFSDQD